MLCHATAILLLLQILLYILLQITVCTITTAYSCCYSLYPHQILLYSVYFLQLLWLLQTQHTTPQHILLYSCTPSMYSCYYSVYSCCYYSYTLVLLAYTYRYYCTPIIYTSAQGIMCVLPLYLPICSLLSYLC